MPRAPETARMLSNGVGLSRLNEARPQWSRRDLRRPRQPQSDRRNSSVEAASCLPRRPFACSARQDREPLSGRTWARLVDHQKIKFDGIRRKKLGHGNGTHQQHRLDALKGFSRRLEKLSDWHVSAPAARFQTGSYSLRQSYRAEFSRRGVRALSRQSFAGASLRADGIGGESCAGP